MDEDFSFYLDAARFAQRGICRSQIATQQQAKQPAKKGSKNAATDKKPEVLPHHEDKGHE